MSLAVRLQDVVKTYPGQDRPVLRIERLEMRAGQQLALRGRSGSGKSTLLNLIAGILLPDSGRVEVAGREITGLSESERDGWRGQKLGYVFQTFQLLAGLTVYENLWLAAALGGGDAGKIEYFLERLDLTERRDFLVERLSQGQQQRVAVARALVHQPALVLADEPTGNLDAERALEALSLMRTVCAENGAALLLVSHDPAVIGQFEDCLELPACS
jgi:ABC-type lipoprotein export system ATPase subunit